MASTDFSQNQPRVSGHETSEKDEQSQEAAGRELILSLPREKGWMTPYLYLFQGFWCPSHMIQPINTFQNHFQAKDTDIVVATFPKSGTTWLKALTFAVVNRHHFPPSLDNNNHPLLTHNPHHLVPSFEVSVYGKTPQSPHLLSNMTDPRLFGTHIPFPSLAKSIKKDSNCKIIYICRNPFDNLVSHWMFLNKTKPGSFPTITLEEAFERYCTGVIGFGPFWIHMLGYWKESMARPDKVLFLKYEDLKEDVGFHVRRVAEFLGCGFTQEEVSCGVIENIIKLCCFEKMKALEVNKSGTVGRNIENKYFFRKGEVGDWVNYLSTSMVEKLSKIIEEKLSGEGLTFRVC